MAEPNAEGDAGGRDPDAANETISPPPVDFLRRWVYDNPALADRRELFTRWLDDPTPREDIAAAMGVPLGQLLRAFNDTAPLSEQIEFRYRGIPFTVVSMANVCDDIGGERYPRFGAPMTLRCYLADETMLPQDMFEAADWNYMDAGRPGFLGYAYGVAYGPALYLAGMQSDLAVRYSYLFQGRGGTTEIRVGDEVEEREADELAARYGRHVPVLRRTFQRYWIQILLAAVTTWALAEPGLTELGLLRFPLEPDEDQRGHVVHRVYRELPERLGGVLRSVRVDDRCHLYTVAALADVARYLGDRWQSPGWSAAVADPRGTGVTSEGR